MNTSTYTVKQVFEIRKGKKVDAVLQQKSPESVRYLQIGDLRSNSNIQYTEDVHPVDVTDKDMIIAWDGSNAGTVGFGLEGIIGSTLARLRMRDKFSDQYEPAFLGYFLQSKFRYLQDTATGAAIPHVNKSALEKIEIPKEDLTTQRQLVTALDKIRKIIDTRQRSIDLLDRFLQSTFLNWFGLMNPDFELWDEVEIQSLAKKEKGAIRSGPFGSALTHDKFTPEGDVAVLGIDNAVDNGFKWKKNRFISNEQYQELKRYTVYPRDVIITIMGTVGRSAVVPEDIPLSINTKHLACITLDETQCNPYYLAYSIHSNPYVSLQVKGRGRGAVMEGLNLGIIRKLKLKRAPIQLQNKFEKAFLTINSKKDILQNALLLTETLFQSLLQRAFHGDLTIDSDLQLDGFLENKNFTAIAADAVLIQTLIDRFNQAKTDALAEVLEEDREEENEPFQFETEAVYNCAKDALFHLLKEGLVTQKTPENEEESYKTYLATS